MRTYNSKGTKVMNEQVKFEETEINEDGVYVVKDKKRSRVRNILLGVSVAAGVAIGAGLLSILRTDEEESEEIIDDEGEVNEDAVMEYVLENYDDLVAEED